jgi:16S rRNA (guanine527-N7)-methyltransferase
MERKDFIKTLLALTGENGISFSEEQAEACFEHISLMLDWNQRCNLTRITDHREIIEKHLLDSLIPARWLPQAGPAMDIGTGPGFPGIPLKILHPELNMLLLESNRKKASFLKVLLSRLPLEKVQVLESRWEDLVRTGHPLLEHQLKLATMRAVKLEPAHLSRFAAKLLQPGGVFAWWAGPGADLKWQEAHRETLAAAGMIFEERHDYTLPTLSQQRYLFLWRKEDRPAVTQKAPSAKRVSD